jgi:hypothetical protein
MPAVQTLITTQPACSERHTCPGVHTLPDHAERYVIAKDVHDPEVLEALAEHIGEGEHVGAVPAYVPSLLLDVDGLGALIDDNYREPGDTLFRYEGLPAYSVASDGEDWRRWLAGASEPTWSHKQPNLDALREDREAGLIQRRVRRFSAELTDYELYACQFGYAYNSQFEDIRVLREGEHDIPDLLGLDYWLVSDRLVVPMLYDGAGRFVGAGVLTPDHLEAYQHDRERAWQAAEPWDSWWSRHPELHRSRAAA